MYSTISWSAPLPYYDRFVRVNILHYILRNQDQGHRKIITIPSVFSLWSRLCHFRRTLSKADTAIASKDLHHFFESSLSQRPKGHHQLSPPSRSTKTLLQKLLILPVSSVYNRHIAFKTKTNRKPKQQQRRNAVCRDVGLTRFWCSSRSVAMMACHRSLSMLL